MGDTSTPEGKQKALKMMMQSAPQRKAKTEQFSLHLSMAAAITTDSATAKAAFGPFSEACVKAEQNVRVTRSLARSHTHTHTHEYTNSLACVDCALALAQTHCAHSHIHPHTHTRTRSILHTTITLTHAHTADSHPCARARDSTQVLTGVDQDGKKVKSLIGELGAFIGDKGPTHEKLRALAVCIVAAGGLPDAELNRLYDLAEVRCVVRARIVFALLSSLVTHTHAHTHTHTHTSTHTHTQAHTRTRTRTRTHTHTHTTHNTHSVHCHPHTRRWASATAKQ
jgi:hypothetical protein